ncbi:hypothetical protein SAMN04487968_111126 [Nocardioides terrae]|uniref:Cellulose synthase n=1 Tax=Nocardioides terrae TaxID=574651 RepID=A0A1I1M275_9ACTN|nr:hypothetical protein [Nocardioides terrae]SFC79489.1 hypothetical protein SAMN04487968_111126 [Nocardioides terrae]
MLDSVTWGAFTLTFTVLGGVGAWLAYRRRGLRAGLRWTAATLLLPAAYFTRTLKMFGRIGSAIADWATSFVWNPLVWVGLALAVVSVLLFFVAARLPGRDRPKRDETKAAPRGRGAPALPGSDPEMAEIEALLKQRGIK